MAHKNCWEIKNCGRQPGGLKTKEFGVCPASNASGLDGLNGGKMGGRACWAIAGTLCGGKIQGEYAAKLGNCLQCEFYQLVRTEEGKAFLGGKDILTRMK